MRLPDLVLLDDDERLAIGQPETGLRGDDGRVTGDRVERAPPLGIPHHRLEFPLVVLAGKVTALRLKRVEEPVVHGRCNYQVAVTGTP